MSEPQKAAQAAPVEQVVEKGLLDQIVEDGRLAKDVSGRERGKIHLTPVTRPRRPSAIRS